MKPKRKAKTGPPPAERALHSVSQKALVEMLITSRKVVLEWETVGMPRNEDKTYDLYAVLPWLKARWLKEDVGMEGAEPSVRKRYQAAQALDKEIQAAARDLDLQRKRSGLLDREVIRDGFGSIANLLRQAGETLERHHGKDAHAVLDGALTDAERVLREMVGTGEDKG